MDVLQAEVRVDSGKRAAAKMRKVSPELTSHAQGASGITCSFSERPVPLEVRGQPCFCWQCPVYDRRTSATQTTLRPPLLPAC